VPVVAEICVTVERIPRVEGGGGGQIESVIYKIHIISHFRHKPKNISNPPVNYYAFCAKILSVKNNIYIHITVQLYRRKNGGTCKRERPYTR